MNAASPANFRFAAVPTSVKGALISGDGADTICIGSGMTRILRALSEVSSQYDVLFCDLWGCLHNGRAAFPAAVAALQEFRAGCGIVVLLTNAPRPSWGITGQLQQLGVPKDAYHLIVSSGDAAQAAVVAGDFGTKVYHIGPERDLVFFEDENGRSLGVERVSLEQAEGIICTGLFDDRTETPDDYRHTILTGINRGLPLLCANPDIVVDVGETRIYCAGAIAKAYGEAGGDARYYGKPHTPIYELARQRTTVLTGRDVEVSRILAIGDGIATDVPGALGESIDCLFVTGGLAAENTGTTADAPDARMLTDYLNKHEMTAPYAISFLR